MPIKRNYQGNWSFRQAAAIISLVLLSAISLFAMHSRLVVADELDEINKQLSSKTQELREVSAKIEQLTKDQSVTQAELNSLQAQINSVREALVTINENLDIRRASLKEKLQLRDRIVRAQYQSGRLTDLEFFLLNSSNLNGFQFASLAYIFDKSLAEEALKIIDKLNTEISSFERDQDAAEKLAEDLETDQQSLVALKVHLDTQRAFAEDVAADLEEEIAELSAKQEAILAAKSGDFSASLSGGVETDDSRTSPNYKPGFSPAFGVFSYGAYTHRNGMSQYGARGRAEDGQDYKEILKFYYGVGVKKNNDLDSKKIKICGGPEKKMGDYLKGLGEMPPSWHEDALQAQAVAARTYANNYTKNGNCICTTTNCQYYDASLEDRSDRKRWYDAIKDTKDEILDGNVSAQYSSTTGGWINGRGWDTPDNKFSEWPNDAYEKEGGSPWFFKAWFTQTYKRDSSTCGLSSPWLDGEEMADILNAYALLKAKKNTERIVPETLNKCPISGVSGKPYNKSEMRSKSSSVGGGFEKVTGVSTPTFSDGRTTKLTFQTNKGPYEVDGQLFAKAFNLRAPGYIAIKHTPDSKALFEVVKK